MYVFTSKYNSELDTLYSLTTAVHSGAFWGFQRHIIFKMTLDSIKRNLWLGNVIVFLFVCICQKLKMFSVLWNYLWRGCCAMKMSKQQNFVVGADVFCGFQQYGKAFFDLISSRMVVLSLCADVALFGAHLVNDQTISTSYHCLYEHIYYLPEKKVILHTLYLFLY